MKSLIASATTFTMFLLCFNLVAQDAAEPKKKATIDWKEVDSAKFAAKLEKATAAGEKWTSDPVSIILNYAGPFISKEGEKAAANRTIRINTKGDELPKTLNVVLIDDGLLDDSVKTLRTRLALARQENGSWKLRKIYKSQAKWPKIGE